jgi:hypothetical protein
MCGIAIPAFVTIPWTGQAHGQSGAEIRTRGASVAGGLSWRVSDFVEGDLASVGLSARGAMETAGFGAGLALSRWPNAGEFRLLNTHESRWPDLRG